MVKLGKTMWNAMVNANCSRERMSASISMARTYAQAAPLARRINLTKCDRM
jgi:hypothetical protein